MSKKKKAKKMNITQPVENQQEEPTQKCDKLHKAATTPHLIMSDAILALLFLGILLCAMTMTLCMADLDFSEEENRTLSSRPKLTWTNLLDGRFADGLEKWLGDQLVGRSALRQVHVMERLAGGDREEQAILLGAEGQLVERIAEPDEEALEHTMHSLGNAVARHPDISFYMMLVPDSGEILKDCLPGYVGMRDQREIFQKIRESLVPFQQAEETGEETAETATAETAGIRWIDVYSTLWEHRQERIYYKTDHHWTSLGAYYGYEAFRTVVSRESEAESAGEMLMSPLTVTDSFQGVLARNSGFDPGVKESIEIYIPGEELPLIVNYPGEQKRTTTLYDRESLLGADQYKVFLGGNSALVDIQTASNSAKTILVVKDSFANCFVPFLVRDYSEIVVVDPRYFAGSVEGVITDYSVDEVLFCYRGNTFVQDNDLYGFLD